jgi:hypothetical protein
VGAVLERVADAEVQYDGVEATGEVAEGEFLEDEPLID